MDHVAEQEERTRKLYRRVLFAGLALAVVVAIWMAIPVRPIDFRFLADLHPTKVSRNSDAQWTLEFKQPPPEIEAELARRLNQSHWEISHSGGATSYYYRGPRAPSVYISPFGKSGTVMSVADYGGMLVMPKWK